MLIYELVVAVLFLALSVGICVMARGLPLALAPSFWVSSGCFPFVLGAILTLLSLWWILDLLVKLKHEKNSPSADKKTSWLDELFGNRQQKLHLAIIMAGTLIFVFVLIPVLGGLSREYGFVLASFLFLCVTIKLFNDMKLWKVVLISAATVAIIYVVFHFGLKVLMPV